MGCCRWLPEKERSCDFSCAPVILLRNMFFSNAGWAHVCLRSSELGLRWLFESTSGHAACLLSSLSPCSMRKSQKCRPIILGCLCKIAGYSHCATVHLRLGALYLCRIENCKQDGSGLKMKVLCHIIGIWRRFKSSVSSMFWTRWQSQDVWMGRGEKNFKRAPYAMGH